MLKVGQERVDLCYWRFIQLQLPVYILQTQEEVCDLKHAAPFQNIIPKPFIPIKGTASF